MRTKGIEKKKTKEEAMQETEHIINPQRIPMDSMENRIKKRIFDVVFSGLVIVFVMYWLYPIID